MSLQMLTRGENMQKVYVDTFPVAPLALSEHGGGVFGIWTCDLLTIEWMLMEIIDDTFICMNIIYMCILPNY